MNITELKEKLTKWDEVDVNDESKSLYPSLSPMRHAFAEGSIYQHSQDAKTITALLSIIEEMQDAIKHTNDFCLCTRNTTGFDYHEDHKVQGKPKSGSRWITPRDYNKQTLTATEQKLKELGEG